MAEWPSIFFYFFLYLFTVFAKTRVIKNEQTKRKKTKMRSIAEQLDRVKNLLEENLEKEGAAE